MKVAITASGKTLADPVSAEFSTCKYVLIVDDSNRSIDAIQKEKLVLQGIAELAIRGNRRFA